MEPLYQSIFETTGTATVIIEADTTIALVNTEFVNLSGYRKEEVEGKLSWTTFIHSDDLDVMLERHRRRRLKPESVPKRYEFRFIDREKNVKDISLTLELIPGTERSVVSLLDITENRKTQEALEHRLGFERIISMISRKFINLPPEEIDAGINEALKVIGEFSNADRSYVFLFTDDLQAMNNTHEWCAAGVEPQIQNLQDLPSDITPWWTDRIKKRHTINLPSLDALPPEAEKEKKMLSEQNIKSLAVVPLSYKDYLKGFLGFDSTKKEKNWHEDDFLLLHTIGDIIINSLERKTFEIRLERSEKRYREFLNFLPQAVFEADLEGELSFVNRQAYKLFEYTENDFNRGVTIFQMIAPKDWETVRRNIQHIHRGETTPGVEYTGVTKSGREFSVLIYSSPVYINQQIQGIRGIIIDLTARKELEDQLRQSQKMEAIGRLAGGIAHDFNNILTSIVGYCHLLFINERLTEECEREVENILIVAKSGALLTKQLLAFSRKQFISPKIININETVINSKKIMDRLFKNNIIINTELEKNLHYIKADTGQIEQIIMNCVINSADAMPKGGEITVRTYNTTLDNNDTIQEGDIKPGRYVCLQISDTGFGIDDETKDKVFDPFFTTKEQGRGTGLGLSTVYGIVKQNGGYLGLWSKVNIGTTISSFFPADLSRGRS